MSEWNRTRERSGILTRGLPFGFILWGRDPGWERRTFDPLVTVSLNRRSRRWTVLRYKQRRNRLVWRRRMLAKIGRYPSRA